MALTLSYFGTTANDRRKRTSRQHEKMVAKTFEGIQTIGSGNKGMKADVWAGDRAAGQRLMVECKATEKDHVVLQVDWVVKLSKEARESGHEPVLALRYRHDNVEQDFALIPLDRWAELAEWTEPLPEPDVLVAGGQRVLRHPWFTTVAESVVPFVLYLKAVKVVDRRAWVVVPLERAQALFEAEATRLLSQVPG